MDRRHVSLALVILGLIGAAGALPADAADKRSAMKAKPPVAHEVCVPLNGKYGPMVRYGLLPAGRHLVPRTAGGSAGKGAGGAVIKARLLMQRL